LWAEAATFAREGNDVKLAVWKEAATAYDHQDLGVCNGVQVGDVKCAVQFKLSALAAADFGLVVEASCWEKAYSAKLSPRERFGSKIWEAAATAAAGGDDAGEACSFCYRTLLEVIPAASIKYDFYLNDDWVWLQLQACVQLAVPYRSKAVLAEASGSPDRYQLWMQVVKLLLVGHKEAAHYFECIARRAEWLFETEAGAVACVSTEEAEYWASAHKALEQFQYPDEPDKMHDVAMTDANRDAWCKYKPSSTGRDWEDLWQFWRFNAMLEQLRSECVENSTSAAWSTDADAAALLDRATIVLRRAALTRVAYEQSLCILAPEHDHIKLLLPVLNLLNDDIETNKSVCMRRSRPSIRYLLKEAVLCTASICSVNYETRDLFKVWINAVDNSASANGELPSQPNSLESFNHASECWMRTRDAMLASGDTEVLNRWREAARAAEKAAKLWNDVESGATADSDKDHAKCWDQVNPPASIAQCRGCSQCGGDVAEGESCRYSIQLHRARRLCVEVSDSRGQVQQE